MALELEAGECGDLAQYHLIQETRHTSDDATADNLRFSGDYPMLLRAGLDLECAGNP